MQSDRPKHRLSLIIGLVGLVVLIAITGTIVIIKTGTSKVNLPADSLISDNIVESVIDSTK